jgi:hypothetical protein
VWKETNLHVVVVKILGLQMNSNGFVGVNYILCYQIGDFKFEFLNGKL